MTLSNELSYRSRRLWPDVARGPTDSGNTTELPGHPPIFKPRRRFHSGSQQQVPCLAQQFITAMLMCCAREEVNNAVPQHANPMFTASETTVSLPFFVPSFSFLSCPIYLSYFWLPSFLFHGVGNNAADFTHHSTCRSDFPNSVYPWA
jgi:hypothetical protein